MGRKHKSLNSSKNRKSFIIKKVLPRIEKLSAEEVKHVAFAAKSDSQRESEMLAVMAIKESGRMDELITYKKMIRQAVDRKFTSWEKDLANELQSIATSIVISDLVGSKFVGSKDSYSYEGKLIEVTEQIVDDINEKWNAELNLDIPTTIVR